jgi:hypothetical protein
VVRPEISGTAPRPALKKVFQDSGHLFRTKKSQYSSLPFYSLTMLLPHLGHFISKQGLPLRCWALAPQEGQTQFPAGPAPGRLPPMRPLPDPRPIPPPPPVPGPWPAGPVPSPLGIFHFSFHKILRKFQVTARLLDKPSNRLVMTVLRMIAFALFNSVAPARSGFAQAFPSFKRS